MIKELIVIEDSADSWEEAIKHTSDALLNKGYVKDSFYKACVDREKLFPTGIPSDIPVAIPHTDAGHVNTPAVCLLRLAKPVSFASIDDSDIFVDVEFVFNMALAKCEDQLQMIKAIITTVQDTAFWERAKNMDLSDIYDTLYESWSASGVIE